MTYPNYSANIIIINQLLACNCVYACYGHVTRRHLFYY